jgi:hypothetical protein
MALVSGYESAPLCSVCRKGYMNVIEVRQSSLSTRRRRACTACGRRGTYHEIDQETFDELKKAKDSLAKILKLLGKTAKPKPTLAVKKKKQSASSNKTPCFDCAHFHKLSGCSFDFPEAMTPDAEGCLHFISV